MPYLSSFWKCIKLIPLWHESFNSTFHFLYGTSSNKILWWMHRHCSTNENWKISAEKLLLNSGSMQWTPVGYLQRARCSSYHPLTAVHELGKNFLLHIWSIDSVIMHKKPDRFNFSPASMKSIFETDIGDDMLIDGSSCRSQINNCLIFTIVKICALRNVWTFPSLSPASMSHFSLYFLFFLFFYPLL